MWGVKVSRPDKSGVLQHHSTIPREKLIAIRDKNEGLNTYGKEGLVRKTYTSVCGFCKKEFQSVKKVQMFCPPQVMMRKYSCTYLFNKERKKKPMIKKVCICCKETYETRIPHQMFCRNPCKASSIKITRKICVCGRPYRTHRAEIRSCTQCRGTDIKYGVRG